MPPWPSSFSTRYLGPKSICPPKAGAAAAPQPPADPKGLLNRALCPAGGVLAPKLGDPGPMVGDPGPPTHVASLAGGLRSTNPGGGVRTSLPIWGRRLAKPASVASSPVADFDAGWFPPNPAHVASSRTIAWPHDGHSVARSGTAPPHFGQFMMRNRDPQHSEKVQQTRGASQWLGVCECLNYRTKPESESFGFSGKIPLETPEVRVNFGG